MKLKRLCMQDRLNILELDEFLSQFLDVFKEYTTKDAAGIQKEDEPPVNNDIDLENKYINLSKSLSLYETAIKRSPIYSESAEMTRIDKVRIELFNDHQSLIKSYRTAVNTIERLAYEDYKLILKEYKYIRSQTTSARSATIKAYVEAIKGKTGPFEDLHLAEKTNLLNANNNQYMDMSTERTSDLKNRAKSPTSCRQQCISDYRELVALINFTEHSNSSLLYEDMVKELNALTIKTQELVKRRMNAAAKKKEENVENPKLIPSNVEENEDQMQEETTEINAIEVSNTEEK